MRRLSDLDGQGRRYVESISFSIVENLIHGLSKTSSF